MMHCRPRSGGSATCGVLVANVLQSSGALPNLRPFQARAREAAVAMNIDELRKQVAHIEAEARKALAGVASIQALREIRSRFLGKKAPLSKLMGTIRDHAPEVRGQVGQALNQANKAVTALFDGAAKRISSSESAAEASKASAYDPTLPGIRPALGNVHPVTAVQWEIEHVFQRLGFTVEAGPEMETDY